MMVLDFKFEPGCGVKAKFFTYAFMIAPILV